jgi:hypothetical protein
MECLFMADVETYGGKCPCCGNHMMQKGDDQGMSSWLLFDACPWCGFAFGEEAGGMGVPIKNQNLWNSIFSHHGVGNREELIESLKLKPKEDGDPMFYPGVFIYNEEFLKRIEELNEGA